MKKKPTITIGIPAYNEEQNIGNLLLSLLKQDMSSFKLDKIIVLSDGSKDGTARISKQFISNKIFVIGGKDRKGKGFRKNQLANITDSDILVIIDADILLPSQKFLNHLIRPIVNNNADITSCRKMPLNAVNGFEKVINYSVKIKNILFENISKNNVYLCNGESIAFSKRLYKKIKWPNTIGVDAYTYLYCKQNNYKFQYVASVNVLYRSPQNFTDHHNQSARFNLSTQKMKMYFGADFVNKEYSIKSLLYLRILLSFFVRNPYLFVKFIIFYFISKHAGGRKSLYENSSSYLWAISKSSKKLAI